MSDLAIQTKTLTKNYGSVRALRGVDRNTLTKKPVTYATK